MTGFATDVRITYVIGETYLGNSASNANTNTFLNEIGRNGFVGYIFSIVFISLFLLFLEFM